MQTMFTRHWTNFRPAENFDRILCSHWTVQNFPSVHKKLGTAKRIIFFSTGRCYVNVVIPYKFIQLISITYEVIYKPLSCFFYLNVSKH